MTSDCARPSPFPRAVIERLKAVVGRAGYLDDPADIAPYCKSWRDNWVGDVAARAAAAIDRGGRRHRAHLRRGRRRHRAAGRQHRAYRRAASRTTT